MEQYMEQARMLAAQCWCDKETSGTEMDTVLAEAIARRISIWMETAYQMARNADFYRGILDECAKHFGEAAYTADDGTVMGEPLLLKVPELVAALVKACEEANDTAKLRAEVARLKAALKKANEQAEHFEREWYLRGDALDEFALYFTSGNSVPVERATIRAKDFWRITGMAPNAEVTRPAACGKSGEPRDNEGLPTC